MNIGNLSPKDTYTGLLHVSGYYGNFTLGDGQPVIHLNAQNLQIGVNPSIEYDGGAVFCSILGGTGNDIAGSSQYSSIGAGQGNSIFGSVSSAILAGVTNNISDASYSSIVNGKNINIGYQGVTYISDSTSRSKSATKPDALFLDFTGGTHLRTGGLTLYGNNPLTIQGTNTSGSFTSQSYGLELSTQYFYIDTDITYAQGYFSVASGLSIDSADPQPWEIRNQGLTELHIGLETQGGLYIKTDDSVYTTSDFTVSGDLYGSVYALTASTTGDLTDLEYEWSFGDAHPSDLGAGYGAVIGYKSKLMKLGLQVKHTVALGSVVTVGVIQNGTGTSTFAIISGLSSESNLLDVSSDNLIFEEGDIINFRTINDGNVTTYGGRITAYLKIIP